MKKEEYKNLVNSNIIEAIVVNHFVIMAQQSLDPESYEKFCEAHDVLVETRGLPNDRLS